MIKRLKKYFRSKKKLEEELERKKDQTEQMHEHIMKQREEIRDLKKQLRINRQMWDISNNQKTY